MFFPSSITVTEQEIDLTSLSEAQREYFFKLKDRVVDIYKKGGQDRAIVTFTGISGIGKSVTVAILKTLIDQESYEFDTDYCGIDAFSYINEYLAEHNLHDVKGRYDTYDTSAMNKTLMRYKHGHVVTFPRYSRKVHAPERGGFVVTAPKALLLLEGLWLLRNDENWSSFRDMYLHNFFIEGDESVTKPNTISRHMRGGRSQEDAELYYESSDHANVVEVLTNSVEPDEKISYFGGV